MKKLSLLAFCAMFAFVVSGCGSGDDAAKGPPPADAKVDNGNTTVEPEK